MFFENHDEIAFGAEAQLAADCRTAIPAGPQHLHGHLDLFVLNVLYKRLVHLSLKYMPQVRKAVAGIGGQFFQREPDE